MRLGRCRLRDHGVEASCVSDSMGYDFFVTRCERMMSTSPTRGDVAFRLFLQRHSTEAVYANSYDIAV